MTLSLDSAGLNIEDFDQILEARLDSYRSSFGVNVITALQSVLGQLARIDTEFELKAQEVLQDLYDAFDPNSADGAALDRIARLTGSTRNPATRSTAPALFTGTPGTSVTNGNDVQLDQTGTLWEVVDGPYLIPAGGSIAGTIQAVETGPTTALTTGPSGWTIVDAIAGWDTVENTADATVGSDIESDADFRLRLAVEFAAPGLGPLDAIQAHVSKTVANLTFVRAYENTALTTDALGRPGKSVEVVVEGGDDVDIAQAIWEKKGGGIQAYGIDISEVIVDSEGNDHLIEASRVQQITAWVRITLTTSTSEKAYPTNGDDVIADAVLKYGNANDDVGEDVLAWKFAGVVEDTGVEGIDNVLAEVSDDGATWVSKVSISDRERAVYDSTRIEILQV